MIITVIIQASLRLSLPKQTLNISQEITIKIIMKMMNTVKKMINLLTEEVAEAVEDITDLEIEVQEEVEVAEVHREEDSIIRNQQTSKRLAAFDLCY